MSGYTKGVVNIKILALYQRGHERGLVVPPGRRNEGAPRLATALYQLPGPPVIRIAGAARVPSSTWRPGALWATRGATNSKPFGTLVEQPHQGLDGQPDTEVVSNNVAGDGDVEVTADQNAL